MKLFVKLIDGLFTLYEAETKPESLKDRLQQQGEGGPTPIGIACKAQTAQSIQDYCNAIYPAGTKIQWLIVPRPWASSRPRIPMERIA